LVEISFTFLSDIERGRKWISAETLAKIAVRAKIDVSELFKAENDEIKPGIEAIVVQRIDTEKESLNAQIANVIAPTVNKIIHDTARDVQKYYESRLKAPPEKEPS
jgi:transcriptional regulator with XRE-family HTH domain